MAYHYLDIMKRALPESAIDAKQRHTGNGQSLFYVFGSYDLLQADDEAYKSITAMKRKHEERHRISWQYERQPVFLYCIDDEKYNDVLNTGTDYNDYPLVLTLVQLDKNALVNNIYIESVEFLLKETQSLIDSLLKDAVETDEAVDVAEAVGQQKAFAVAAWNLGGTDLVILSRAKKLCYTGYLLNRLQAEGITIKDNNIQVFSMSSHCGIANEDGERWPENCLKWLEYDDSVELNAFMETASGFDGVLGIRHKNEDLTAQMILGERDFRIVQKHYGIDYESRYQNVSIISALSGMYRYDPKTENAHAYRSSYIVPSIELDDIVHSSHHIDYVVWKESDDRVFKILEDIAESTKNDHVAYGGNASKIADQVYSIENSLLGLKKYSFRLGASIQQHDLFCRIQRIYSILEVLLDRYIILLNETDLDGQRTYLDELVTSLQKIVTELQHLFTVLALSPHTYIETYSSSMRSLNAASKLWFAFNGCLDAIQEALSEDGQRCEALLTPYRERMSSNELLFAKASEKDTLIHLQMNFGQMFNKKQAIFMLAHEMGHHLGKHLRESRILYMTQYLLGLEIRHIAGPIISTPLYELTKLLMDKAVCNEYDWEEYRNTALGLYYGNGDITEENAEMLFPLIILRTATTEDIIDLYDKESASIRDLVRTKLSELIVELSEKFISEYRNNEAFCLDYKVRNYFSDAVADAYRNQKSCSITDLVRRNSAEVKNAVSESALIYINSIEDKYDITQIARLKAAWKLWKEEEELSSMFNSEMTEKYILNATKVFKEIHADIVAIRLLDITSAEDYLGLIGEYYNVYPPIFSDGRNAVRILSVLHTVFYGRDTSYDSLRETANDICRWMEHDSQLSSDVWIRGLRNIYDFATSVNPDTVLNYAEQCNEAISRQLEKISERTKLERIRQWYKSRDDDQIDDIWYFWKLSMSDSCC